MKNLLTKFENITNKGQDIALLFLRLMMAYGMWEPAKHKWADINSVAEWFGGMGLPFPKLNAYMAATTEMLGVFLLLFGFGTKIICVPLIIVMIVAIKTVHWVNGYAAGENGYEIPLYFILMLITLLCFGSGKISVDYLVKRMRGK